MADALITMILDRSGSMGGRETDVIGHYNAYMEEIRDLPGVETNVTLVLFDDQYQVIHNNQNIKYVPELTRDTYFVRGSTALLDAIGRAIRTVDALKDKPSKIVFVINTDGYENASREFTRAQIKEMVTERQNNHDWQFVFAGADIDAFGEGASIGINWQSTIRHSNTSRGYDYNNYITGIATTDYLTGASSTISLDSAIENTGATEENIDEYTNAKKKRKTGSSSPR